MENERARIELAENAVRIKRKFGVEEITEDFFEFITKKQKVGNL
jgi:hypothetical protein